MARKLLVEIVGDATKLTRSFNQSTTAANKFGAEVSGSMGKAEKSMLGLQRIAAGGFFGAAAVTAGIAGIKSTTDAASALEEQLSKNNQVFGANANAVEAWSKTTAAAIGISQTAALEATGTFGNLFSAIGITGPAAANTSQRLVKLAADLSSFTNVPTEDALTALRSGLVGEAEPLRRFGVLLSEARVQQVALAETGKTSAASLTQQEKAYARLTIIFRDTIKAQGDFERTSGSLANQQRALGANVSDLQANIGTLLLPAVTEMTTALADATTVAATFAKGLGRLGDIKIPTIVIPFALQEVEVGGGTVGGAAAKGFGLGFLAQLSPTALYAVLIKKAIDRFRGEPPPKTEINALAKKFDDKYATFTNQAVATINKSVDKANKNLKTFGAKGFKPLEANELGESLQRAFDATLDALDLKFDRATFAENTAGAIAALDEIEATIRKRIETEGRTTELLRLLFQVEQDRAAVIAADKAARKADTDKLAQDRKDAAAAIIDALEFGITEAQLTPGLKNDLAAMRALQKGLEKQIAAGMDVVANQRRLKVVTDEITDTQAEIAANAKEAAQSRLQAQQFRALGLTAAGGELTPGLANLQKQFQQLTARADFGDLGSKLANQVARAGKVLSGAFGKVTEETRAAAAGIIDAARDELNQDITKGPLTKTSSLNASKILDGLGLGRDTEKEIRARLSGFNDVGMSLAGGVKPTGSFRGGVPVTVENVNTIVMDGDTIARNVTISQQKAKRRNPTQKRGPNRSGI